MTYDEEKDKLCQDSNDKGNHFFWKKMKDRETLEEHCFCLSDCSIVEYHQFDSFIPISDNCSIGQYNEEYGVYFDEDGNYIGFEANWYEKLSK